MYSLETLKNVKLDALDMVKWDSYRLTRIPLCARVWVCLGAVVRGSGFISVAPQR